MKIPAVAQRNAITTVEDIALLERNNTLRNLNDWRHDGKTYPTKRWAVRVGKGGGALFDGRYRKEKDAAHTYAKKSVPRPLPWCVESARASKWGGLNSESRTDVRKRVPLSFDEERTSNK